MGQRRGTGTSSCAENGRGFGRVRFRRMNQVRRSLGCVRNNEARNAAMPAMTTLQSRLRRVKFSSSVTRAGRIHYLTPGDVRTLLSRLPEELWQRLRAVHFNDRSRGRRCAGYVNRGHREIAICAFPASVSCTLFTSRKRGQSPSTLGGGNSPATFGASRGKQWPRLAVRRFFLYNVFLHELGHLQTVDPSAKTNRRRFASESLAREFANHWRRTLWSQRFDHPDPVHNPPETEELRDARKEDRIE